MADNREAEKLQEQVIVDKQSLQFTKDQIAKIEEIRKAKYVLDTSDSPVDFSYFYTEEAHPEGSNYFKLYYQNNTLLIADGIDIEDKIFDAIYDDGVMYHSRNRWDYRVVGDYFIDGGSAYMRTNYTNTRQFVVRDGEAYEC